MCTCSTMAIATSSIPQSGPLECCYSTGPSQGNNFNHRVQCDACPCCRDTCNDANSCTSCQKKLNATAMPRMGSSPNLRSLFSIICSGESPENSSSAQNTYTMCQLKRHNHAESAWILVGDTIYDATPYIRSHPGGTETILRKSGGAADCTEDMRFHSGRARKEWKKFKVGTLVACPRQSSS